VGKCVAPAADSFLATASEASTAALRKVSAVLKTAAIATLVDDAAGLAAFDKLRHGVADGAWHKDIDPLDTVEAVVTLFEATMKKELEYDAARTACDRTYAARKHVQTLADALTPSYFDATADLSCEKLQAQQALLADLSKTVAEYHILVGIGRLYGNAPNLKRYCNKIEADFIKPHGLALHPKVASAHKAGVAGTLVYE
jgi:hypothetical protein